MTSLQLDQTREDLARDTWKAFLMEVAAEEAFAVDKASCSELCKIDCRCEKDWHRNYQNVRSGLCQDITLPDLNTASLFSLQSAGVVAHVRASSGYGSSNFSRK